MEDYYNEEVPDRDIIIQWFNEAAYSQSTNEKIELFHKIKEFLLRKSPHLLPEFLPNVLNFVTDKSADLKKALVGFIEETSKLNEAHLPTMIINLHMLLCDESIPVQKRVIQATITIYRKMLSWLCRATTITEEMEKGWNELTAMKGKISMMIDNDNDGIRTSAIKFLENVVLLQSYPDPNDAKSSDFSLDDVPLTLKIARRRKLEEEARNVFSQLTKFNISQHISSANLFACIGALTNIGKNRPEFIGEVIDNIVKLHANMPPTLSTTQVNSIRKKLKSELTSLIKHPVAFDHVDTISLMLQELGCSQQEIIKMIPKPEERRKPSKRSTTSESLQSSKKPRLEEKELELSEKQKLAIEANEAFILEHLNKNTALHLVLKSLVNVPDAMPESFKNDYLNAAKVGPTGHLKTISKLFAPQFVEAGVGPGTKYIGKTTLLKEVLNEKVDSKEDEEQKEEKQTPKKEKPKAPRIKTLRLNEITRPLDKTTKHNLLIDAVKRILTADKKGFMNLRPKIVTTVAATFSETVRESVLAYLLYDLRSNLDLALSWLYEEYSIMQGFLRLPELRKDGKINQNYTNLLTAFVLTSSSDPIMLTRLFLEAPMVTDPALEHLCSICKDEHRCNWSMGLLKDLILKRPTRQKVFLNSLLIHMTHDSQVIRDCAVTYVIELYKNGKLTEEITAFVIKCLENLNLQNPPDCLCGMSQGRLDGLDIWTDDLVKACLHPYLALLPLKETLIHDLTKIYIQSGADIKRIILKVLDGPVKQMGMESPELLKLVEECPKGAETLVTRVIQVLTDKGPPSPALVQRVRQLYNTKVSDVRFLIPVLNGLTKREIISALPKLVKLNPVVVKEVFNRLLGLHGESAITPTELLVSLHLIDPAKVDIKTQMKATSMCLQEKQAFTQEVLAVVLQQLMDHTPLPTLLMRTVIQTLSSYPRLIGFVVNILQRLILKQVWKQKVVWEGFVKCCQRTQPQSFAVLLQLPLPQLTEALSMCPELCHPLKEHFLTFTDNQKAHIPMGVQELILGENPLPTIAPMPVPAPIEPPHTEKGLLTEPLPPGMD